MDIENTNSSFINLKVVGKCGVLPATFSLEEDFMAEIVEFNGKRYSINVQGYYRTNNKNSKSTKLHQDVWEYYSGRKIPVGYVIHHIDGNKSNNAFDNLLCCTQPEHELLHREEKIKAGKSKDNLDNLARMRAVQRDCPPRICKECGNSFNPKIKAQIFCSKKCKAKYRYKTGVDRKAHICQCCGKEFMAENKAKRKYCSHKCAGNSQSKSVS